MDSNVLLRVDALTKAFPRNGADPLLVLDRISFNVRRNEVLSIVGPSGCGKTSLLEILARLQEPTGGYVEFASSAGNDLHSSMSLIVFQQYNRSLYPFMRVAANVRFAMDALPALDKAEKQRRVEEVLAVIGLTDFADYFPWELSGGMQQRVALSRAIAARPRLLLLDEVFGSLDTQTRYKLEDELLAIKDRYSLTAVYVTHDIDSAIRCGDRIMVLSNQPTYILDTIVNELPTPRDQIRSRRHQFFADYRERIYGLLKGENEEASIQA